MLIPNFTTFQLSNITTNQQIRIFAVWILMLLNCCKAVIVIR
jgi:hypothetical protein